MEWVLAVMERSPFNGQPVGVREWLAPGGLHEQLAVHVEAAWVVLGEVAEILKPPEPPLIQTP